MEHSAWSIAHTEEQGEDYDAGQEAERCKGHGAWRMA